MLTVGLVKVTAGKSVHDAFNIAHEHLVQTPKLGQNAMSNESAEESILGQLEEIYAEACAFFDMSKNYLQEDVIWSISNFEEIPSNLRDESRTIAGKLAKLAQLTAPAIRRSPLLTEADEREAGHAFKGMRAALRFMQFRHYETEVLHDEGTVLGVSPASETEFRVGVAEAKSEFTKWLDSLKGRLELADLRSNDNGLTRTATKPIAAGYRPGTAFIMMWMSKEHPELEDVVNVIKECFGRFGVAAVRADDIEHEDVITQRIIDEIKTAEFLVADITGERPSVYYEIGYAHALGRRVTMLRRAGTHIHFDIAAYNCPEYKNLMDLRTLLMRRLEALTGGPPRDSV